MIRIVPTVGAALLLWLSGCEMLTLPGAQPRAWEDAGAIMISNPGERPIYYFAIEQSAAALTLWGPCDDPDRCDRVDPGGRAAIPRESVVGFTPEAEVVLVYWWHLVHVGGGEFRPDGVRVEEVAL